MIPKEQTEQLEACVRDAINQHGIQDCCNPEARVLLEIEERHATMYARLYCTQCHLHGDFIPIGWPNRDASLLIDEYQREIVRKTFRETTRQARNAERGRP